MAAIEPSSALPVIVPFSAACLDDANAAGSA